MSFILYKIYYLIITTFQIKTQTLPLKATGVYVTNTPSKREFNSRLGISIIIKDPDGAYRRICFDQI